MIKYASLALCLLLTASCSFHSTSTKWNQRVGPNGNPVYVKSTSSGGLNLFIGIKLWGATDLTGMIDEVTADIAAENGNRVRIIQAEGENYWHGFPPFTWIFTPVITTVAVEYEPASHEDWESEAAPEDGPAEDAPAEEAPAGDEEAAEETAEAEPAQE